MIPYLGDFVEDDTVYLMFNTFTSDDPSASCTITDLLNTDVHIHKDDGLTDRNNAAGITVSVNFDGITGSHMIKMDTSDNTVPGAWGAGHDYFVRIEGTTVDGATINAVVGHFSIENRFMRGTNSAAPSATALSTAVWTAAKAALIDAAISSRNATTPPTVIQIRQEMDSNSTKMAPSQLIADYRATGFATMNPPSQNLNDYKATGFSTHSAANVWAVATRILSANTNLNDLNAAAIKAEVVAALADIKLDHLLNIAVDTDWATTVHLDSVIGHMTDIGTLATFSRTTDALEAIRNRGDSAWVSAGVAPTVIQIRQEMDSNSTRMAPSQNLGDYKATGFATLNPPSQNLADYKATGFATLNPPSQNLIDYKATGFATSVALATHDGKLDTVDTNVDSILLDTGKTLDDMINRLLGLDQENFYIDNTMFTGANMTSCRIRIYSVAGSVGTASDVIATYNMTATYAGDNLASYKMVKA